jgi:hypothetical protein
MLIPGQGRGAVPERLVRHVSAYSATNKVQEIIHFYYI